MICEYVLNTGLTKPDGFYSLEKTRERYTGENPYGEQLRLFSPYTPKSNRIDVGKREKFLTEDVYYGAEDCISVLLVKKYQEKIVEELGMEKVVLLENSFVPVLGDMEFNGMPVDVDRWLDLAEWVKEHLKVVEDELRSTLPEVENWNSHIQVKNAFKKLGINTSTRDKKTGERKDSVNELVIKEQVDKFPIIEVYLKYKGLQKVSSSYGHKFLRYINSTTGRVHTNFLQILNTGRTASSNPNMQNIINGSVEFPEGVWWREAFRTVEGRTFVIADYSSQELRVCANKAKDSTMITALRNGEDLHKIAASGLYGKPLDQITKEERHNGKTTNFAIIYGAGASKLSKQFKVSKAKAQQMIDGWYAKFPKIKKLQEDSYKHSKENGWIKVDSLGRRSYINNYPRLKQLEKVKHLSEVWQKEYSGLDAELFRDSSNYIIQGEAASISKLAGILLRRNLKELDAKIVLLIHDEWVVECSIKDQEKVKEVVETSMREAADKFCKYVGIPADAITSTTWNK